MKTVAPCTVEFPFADSMYRAALQVVITESFPGSICTVCSSRIDQTQTEPGELQGGKIQQVEIREIDDIQIGIPICLESELSSRLSLHIKRRLLNQRLPVFVCAFCTPDLWALLK